MASKHNKARILIDTISSSNATATESLREHEIRKICKAVDSAMQKREDQTIMVSLAVFIEDLDAIKDHISSHEGTQRVAAALSDLFVILTTNDTIVTLRLMMPPKLEALAAQDDSFESVDEINTQQIDFLTGFN